MAEEFGVDLDEVYKVIDSAEVLVVRLHMIQQRLLVDFRTRAGVGPFIAVVPRAESVEDRFRSIKRLRPEFGFPEKVMSFSWPRSVPTLVTSGVWSYLEGRLARLGDVQEQVSGALAQLRSEERSEVTGAIAGASSWQTIWERRRG
jgi:hypothetical protein